jgi:tetratricopeptide (TPR) repeat protein
MRLFSRLGSWLRARGGGPPMSSTTTTSEADAGGQPRAAAAPAAEAQRSADAPSPTDPASAPSTGGKAGEPKTSAGRRASGPVTAPAVRAVPAVLDAEMLARLPRAPAEVFRRRLLDVLAVAGDDVQVAHLDACVRVLALSRAAAARDERIDAALRDVESGPHTLSSITWSALRDARPPFRPAPPEWAPEELAHALDGDVGLLFFVDVEAIAVAVQQAVENLGLAAQLEDSSGIVRVSDGRFVAHVGTSALIAEALWTGVGPLAVVLRRVQQLPAELRSFVAVLRGLERRFVGRRFEVIGERLLVRGAGDVARIDYRQLAAAARASGLAVDAFLAGARLEDLLEQSGDVGVLVRSPAYRKAWPDVVGEEREGAFFVAVREDDGRARPIKACVDDAPERFAFLAREAIRQLPFVRIDGHAFVVEQATGPGIVRHPGARVWGLVGDKAATLLFHPSLLRGFVEQLGPPPASVDVETLSENVVLLCPTDPTCPEDDRQKVLTEARRRALRLEGDLFDDGADTLEVQRSVVLPDVAAGIFDLTHVADEFFLLSDQASRASDVGRVQADYLRGLAFEVLGLHEKAVRAFERAVRARADDGEINLALGRTLSASGEHRRAVGILERAAGALPEHADVQNALGVALYKSGAAADARQAFQRAVKLSPDEVGFLVNLGRTCCDVRLFGEARTVLERALRLEPASAEAHASMAVLCHRTGERQRALQHARAALAEEPDDDTVRELLRMIDDEG